MIRVQCPVCGAQYDVEEQHLGMSVTCSTCNSPFVVQASSSNKKKKPESGNKKSFNFSKAMAGVVPYIKFAVFIGILVGGYFYLDSKGMLNNLPWAKKKTAPEENAVQASEIQTQAQAIEEAIFKRDTVRGFVFSKDKRTLVKAPKYIEKYTIPKGVTQIGDRAFADSFDLVSITIPEGVQKIGKAAFAGNYILESITIPNSVTEISGRALYSVKKINLPENHSTFMLGSSGELINHKTKTLISLPTDFSGTYTIPEAVVHIGTDAFYGCNKLSGITIHDRVTSIGERAFLECRNLRRVTIPDSVKEIGEGAFDRVLVSISRQHPDFKVEKNSGALINDKTNTLLYLPRNFHGHYTIPDSIIKIGDSAFAHCKELRSVTIPETIISIGERAFEDCMALGSAVLPAGLTEIGAGAFKGCSKLRVVTIPGGLTVIPDNIFAYCSGLRSVTISEGITAIGDSAFKRCTSLERITLPNSVKRIGNSAFDGCRRIRKLSVPESVEEIGEYAFFECENLSNFTIPYSVRRIGGGAFAGVQSVEPSSRNHWNRFSRTENGAIFDGDTLLYFPRNFKGDYTIPSTTVNIGPSAFHKCSGLKSITIPEGVTKIGNGAFSYCSSLQSITIPAGVTKIENGAFSYCSSLQSITIPEGVTKIGNAAFSGCSSLQSITIPEGVTKIGNAAFSYCSSLQSITIPEGVTKIEGSAFERCKNLQDVTLSNSIAEIENSAFSYCSSLQSITLPDGVTKIGNDAFSGCSKLQNLTLPVAVVKIGDSAFSGCSSLQSITIPDSVAEIGKRAFEDVKIIKVSPEHPVFKVDAVGALINTDTKTLISFPSTFIKEYTVPEDVVSIDRVFDMKEGAFKRWRYRFYSLEKYSREKGLKNVIREPYGRRLRLTLPNSVENIAEGVLRDVLSVKVSPDNPVFIVDSNGALINTKTKTLLFFPKEFTGTYTIPADVEKIGQEAFYGCLLTGVTIPDGVVEIGDFAFGYCSGLKNVKLPKSIKKVGAGAFALTGALKQVKNDYPDLFKK